MAELFLVRHGQASLGADDYDRLSDVGERQGIWLGEYFAQRDIAFDRVMSGTLRRHAQTVDAIRHGLRALPAECEIHPGLDEYDFHALFRALGETHRQLAEQATRSPRDFFKALRQVLHLWAEGALDGGVPETWRAFQQRVADARAAIQQGSGQRVLVVSSGGVIAALTQQILQAPAATAIALNMQIRNSSVSHYFFNRDALHLSSFNGIGHLDDPQRRAYQTYG
ncbi:histidine phosphatase family protein [Paraburkholderia sp. LEh10]|jgi:broad specificity phosphatase PhoE|uniref:histidine phosphatase family protein n=1 Tax=Paraburkholderia sp. LEh10 TaxID=2821353 RepID=UPI001AE6924F|nr:histidine phosphatase family protein [Paraburkholderia sp. LEh10]MBP0594426.1 histidine phosphatase family protein [Paraburkholderia sp. LEh10]